MQHCRPCQRHLRSTLPPTLFLHTARTLLEQQFRVLQYRKQSVHAVIGDRDPILDCKHFYSHSFNVFRLHSPIRLTFVQFKHISHLAFSPNSPSIFESSILLSIPVSPCFIATPRSTFATFHHLTTFSLVLPILQIASTYSLKFTPPSFLLHNCFDSQSKSQK